MSWLVVGAAAVAVAIIIALLRVESRASRERPHAFAVVTPLRMVTGALLILVVVLSAVGMLFVLPKNGEPSAVMIAYWLFIGLVSLLVMLLAVLDVMIVRHGYRRGQDQALFDALVKNPGRQTPSSEEGPGADSGSAS